MLKTEFSVLTAVRTEGIYIMLSLICPCCGEKYHVDTVLETGRKVLCGRCKRKHIYYNSKLVPFACDLSSGELVRQISCPVCQEHFLIGKEDAGEYFCAICGAIFYVGMKPEVVPNSVAEFTSDAKTGKKSASVKAAEFATGLIEKDIAVRGPQSFTTFDTMEQFTPPKPPPAAASGRDVREKLKYSTAPVTVKMSDEPVHEEDNFSGMSTPGSSPVEASETSGKRSLSEEFASRLKKNRK